MTQDALLDAITAKKHLHFQRTLALGILAGMYISLGAHASMVGSFGVTEGVAKAIASLMFAGGLIMISTGAGDLFTGNILLITSWYERRARFREVLLNWLVIWSTNGLGAALVLTLLVLGGKFNDPAILSTAFGLAWKKMHLTATQGITLGMLCNFLVCTGVWVAIKGKTITEKVAGILFPIWLFVVCGYEHSIANMYFIPAGIEALKNPDFVNHLLSQGFTPEGLAEISYANMFTQNLWAVTLGNILGGMLFAALIYILPRSWEKRHHH